MFFVASQHDDKDHDDDDDDDDDDDYDDDDDDDDDAFLDYDNGYYYHDDEPQDVGGTIPQDKHKYMDGLALVVGQPWIECPLAIQQYSTQQWNMLRLYIAIPEIKWDAGWRFPTT